MPEINQYMFTTRELVEMMVKSAGLHEGKWVMAVTFGFGAGNFGQTENDVSPGAVVGIQKIGIQRATPDVPPAMYIDAAVENPRVPKK